MAKGFLGAGRWGKARRRSKFGVQLTSGAVYGRLEFVLDGEAGVGCVWRRKDSIGCWLGRGGGPGGITCVQRLVVRQWRFAFRTGHPLISTGSDLFGTWARPQCTQIYSRLRGLCHPKSGKRHPGPEVLRHKP